VTDVNEHLENYSGVRKVVVDEHGAANVNENGKLLKFNCNSAPCTANIFTAGNFDQNGQEELSDIHKQAYLAFACEYVFPTLRFALVHLSQRFVN